MQLRCPRLELQHLLPMGRRIISRVLFLPRNDGGKKWPSARSWLDSPRSSSKETGRWITKKQTINVCVCVYKKCWIMKQRRRESFHGMNRKETWLICGYRMRLFCSFWKNKTFSFNPPNLGECPKKVLINLTPSSSQRKYCYWWRRVDGGLSVKFGLTMTGSRLRRNRAAEWRCERRHHSPLPESNPICFAYSLVRLYHLRKRSCDANYSAGGLAAGWPAFALAKETGIHHWNRWIGDPFGPPVGDRPNSSVDDD